MASKVAEYTFQKAGEVATRLISEGYQSVFEKILDSSHRGPKIYTLWIHLGSGICKLTISEQWHTTIYIVTPEQTMSHIPE